MNKTYKSITRAATKISVASFNAVAASNGIVIDAGQAQTAVDIAVDIANAMGGKRAKAPEKATAQQIKAVEVINSLIDVAMKAAGRAKKANSGATYYEKAEKQIEAILASKNLSKSEKKKLFTKGLKGC